MFPGLTMTDDKELTNFCTRFTLDPSLSLASVAQALPFTYTGADFYALCSDAMLKAVTRQASAVDAKLRTINAERSTPVSTAYYFDHHATAEDIAVMVTEEDFIAAHRELIPSVSAGELVHYEKVRASFEGDKGASSGGASAMTSSEEQRKRAMSSSAGSRPGWKGKGKASIKGKGKAVATSDDEYEDEMAIRNGNGHVNGKGKGKAVAGFQDGTASDDDGLY